MLPSVLRSNDNADFFLVRFLLYSPLMAGARWIKQIFSQDSSSASQEYTHLLVTTVVRHLSGRTCILMALPPEFLRALALPQGRRPQD